MNDWFETLFPGLVGTAWRVTSPPTDLYNCIAWAGEVDHQWWWPFGLRAVWPAGIPCERTVAAFETLYRSLGFQDAQDDSLEIGFVKVAVFANDSGQPTHAARQLPSGDWTSKLGQAEDIEHELRAVEGDIYGRVVLFLKRAIRMEG